MKKLFMVGILSLVCCLSAYAFPPVGLAISNQTCILPDRTIMDVPTWTSGDTVAVGQYRKNSSGVVYLVVHTGPTNSVGEVTTNSPTVVTGYQTLGDIAITWYRIQPYTRPRVGLAVFNNSANVIYGNFGEPAQTGKGFLLAPYGTVGSSLVIPQGAPQGAVYVLVGGTTNSNIQALEW